MRILQIGKFYPPHQGGMETVLETLCRGSVGKGHQVTVFCYNDSSENLHEQIDGVDVHRFATYGELFSQPISPGLLLSIKKGIVNPIVNTTGAGMHQP